jgi:hypothetical protein
MEMEPMGCRPGRTGELGRAQVTHAVRLGVAATRCLPGGGQSPVRGAKSHVSPKAYMPRQSGCSPGFGVEPLQAGQLLAHIPQRPWPLIDPPPNAELSSLLRAGDFLCLPIALHHGPVIRRDHGV